MTIRRSCSWCDELNDSRVKLCSNCGHFAQVPRTACLCLKCAAESQPLAPASFERRFTANGQTNGKGAD